MLLLLLFFWISSPLSLGYVTHKLDSYLGTEYKYISTERTRGEGGTVTYYFEGVNGVKFDVITFPRFGDYDSSQPGYPRCDYLTAYYEFNKESIEKSLQCGLPITWENTGIYSSFIIKVSSYDELETVASVLEKALNTFPPLISINYSASASDKFQFYIPEISVWTVDVDKERVISVFDFRLIKGQMPWTREEILNKLYGDYKANIAE